MKTFLIILISLVVIAASALWYFSDTVSASIAKIRTSLTKTTIKSANNTGLIGYWNFDTVDKGTTLFDKGSGHNDLTLNAELLTATSTQFTGKVNEGGLFDGSDDYATKADTNNSLDLTTKGTLSAWIYPFKYNTAVGGVISKRTNDLLAGIEYTLACCISTGGSVRLNLASASVSELIVSNATPPLNQWTHIAATWNGGTWILYINGELDKQETGHITLGAKNNPFSIGVRNSDGSGTTPWFKGLIDEVRVYNLTLSATEIKTLYQQGSAKFTIKSANNTGLVGYWNFDDCDTCSTAIDRSGNGRTGTMYNAAGPTVGNLHTAAGKTGNGIYTDGINDFVDTSDTPFDFTSSFSVSAWAKISDYNQSIAVLLWKTSSYGIVYNYTAAALGGSLNANRFIFAVTADTITWKVARQSATAAVDRWYHFVGVFDYANALTNLYVDGALEHSVSSPIGSASNSAYNFRIGNYDYAPDAGYFKGFIDEVRVYNRALSAAEVKALYQSGR